MTDRCSSRGPVCVLGMHRSGTSLIASMVNLLGVELGPERHLLPPQRDNPGGFWEYIPFVRVNARILHRYGGTWDAPPTLPPNWWRGVRVLDLAVRVRAAARRDFGDARLWGWKDPRTCLTLEFWRRLYPRLIPVVCVRNPLDVARSLERREKMPIQQGVRLWELYMAAALKHSEGCDRLVLSYEDVLRDPLDGLQRMGHRVLGEGGEAQADAVATQLDRAVDSTLQHSATPTAEVLDSSRIPTNIRDLYGTLLHEAEHTRANVAAA